MSITLKGNSDIESKTPNVHLMACEIKHDGNASVERYFHKTVREGEDKEYAKVSTLSSSALTLKCPVLTECNRSLWQQPVCFCGLCHCKPYPIYISQVDILKASFRGRPLLGKEITVPKGYTGAIASEKKKTYSDSQGRSLTVEHQFDKFVYWNLETKPSGSDSITQIKDWIEVAHALHTSVSDDEN